MKRIAKGFFLASAARTILHMNDAGASRYADFTHLGFPSTYLLDREEVLHIRITIEEVIRNGEATRVFRRCA